MSFHSRILPLVAVLAALPAVAETCSDTNLSPLPASACMGAFVGSLVGAPAELNALAAEWGGQWSFAGRSDETDFGPFQSNPQVAFNGLLALDTPLFGAFVLGLVSGTQFSWYRMQAASEIPALTFDNTEGVATSPQGNPLGLSYAALYVSAVPEHETAALWLSGLMALRLMARLRKR